MLWDAPKYDQTLAYMATEILLQVLTSDEMLKFLLNILPYREKNPFILKV